MAYNHIIEKYSLQTIYRDRHLKQNIATEAVQKIKSGGGSFLYSQESKSESWALLQIPSALLTRKIKQSLGDDKPKRAVKVEE